MKYKYQEVIFSGAMLAAGLTLLSHTFADQYQNLLTGDDVLSPIFFPRVILTGWCVTAFLMLVNACRLPEKLSKEFKTGHVLVAFGLMLVLLAGILSIGFIAAGIPFVLAFSLFLGYKRKKVAAIAAVIIPLALWLIFEKGLGVLLPSAALQLF